LLGLCASAAPECATYLPVWRELVIVRLRVFAAIEQLE